MKTPRAVEVEPITRGERDYALGQVDVGNYMTAGAYTRPFDAALRASEQREKKLQAELDALNDDGALHAAYLSGQQDAKERISALEQREKKLRDLLFPEPEGRDEDGHKISHDTYLNLVAAIIRIKRSKCKDNVAIETLEAIVERLCRARQALGE